jgi:DNA adenine methylase
VARLQPALAAEGGGRVTVTRPALRYHGGKFRLASWICGFFPAHHTYVEPFGGAASVLLHKARSQNEVYNDAYDDVVNVFRVLRDEAQSEQLARLIELTPFARAEFEASYESTDDPVERARRTVIRSFMGFGSGAAFSKHATGFRTGARGGRNAGAASDLLSWPAAVPAFCERLRGVSIERQDALYLMARLDGPGTLFYVDPPYPLSTRGNARGVRQKYEQELTDDDHRRLAVVLHDLDGMVVLSGYPCDLYDLELFAGWERHERQALADGARKRTEVVWINPACAAALHRSRGGLFAEHAA